MTGPPAGPIRQGAGAPAPPRVRFGWLRVVLGGLLAAAILRGCVMEAYRIPSNSMERTLLVGDFLLVSKLAYGARLGTWRAPALAPVACGDVVVFNHPTGGGAISSRAPYIKRVVALPGETVEVQSKRAVVDGVPLAMPPEGLALYDVRTDGTVNGSAFGSAQRSGERRWIVSAAPDHALGAVPGVVRVEPFTAGGEGGALFPRARRWGLDDFGPIRVPAAGWTVPLTADAFTDYRLSIELHEGRTLERYADGFRLDGVPADSFTFGQDYLFVLGDNRDASSDSRTWGFVPMSHVIGRAERIYFSRDAEPVAPGEQPATGQVRWDRVGRRVAGGCERAG